MNTSGGIWSPRSVRLSAKTLLISQTVILDDKQLPNSRGVCSCNLISRSPASQTHISMDICRWATPVSSLRTPSDDQEYAADPTESWKSKDTAIYLLTSIASRGSTQQVRVAM